MNLDVEYAEYREYIEEFAKSIDPHDQLPLRVSGYCLREYEIHGEIIEWLLTYLGKSCPTTLRIYLIQTALKKILQKVKDAAEECGYDSNRGIYQPLKLVRIVIAFVNSLIFDLQDNAKLYEVPLPPSSPNASELTKLKQPPKISVDAIKNSRRTMEDRHVIIEDFNGFFRTQDTEPTFYYGIFDGHSGSDAATYANSHLNYNISVHPSYPSDIKSAMHAAFLVTDIEFLKKAQAENLSSGTTALCAIYRKTQKKLFVGWCGDSQALISRLGNVHQIVKKHSPEDAQERKRIEDLGGIVLYWSGSYRVNGQLGVSRAIGDCAHKPFVSAEPEISVLDLDGEEDFFVMGCDGLWDSLSEDDVALTVYKRLKENPNNYRTIASDLCSLAKTQGSRDNISVIVVYLKEPELIATQSWPSEITQNKEIMEDIYNPDQPKVSIDPLGNQDIMNNPFGDFMGKSTEITDLVMHQQHENEFANLTDRLTNNLNTINNNLMNNGSHDVDENIISSAIDNSQSYQPQQDILVLNDDNNNSNDNFNSSDFGPETDVDAMEEHDSRATADEAAGGEKEKNQMELKETDDVVDRVEMASAPFDQLGNAEEMFNKIEDNMLQHDPNISNQMFDLSSASDQFTHMQHAMGFEFSSNNGIGQETANFDSNFMSSNERNDVGHYDFENSMQNPFVKENLEQAPFEMDFMRQDNSMQLPEEEVSISANDVNEEVAIQQSEQQITDLETIGTAQAIEESDGSDDEWNYIKVEDKKETPSIIEEHSEHTHNQEQIVESPVAEEIEEKKLVEEQQEKLTVPTEVADHSEQLEENLTESDNKENIEEFEQQEQLQQQPEEIIQEQEIAPIECQLIESSSAFESQATPDNFSTEPVESDTQQQVEFNTETSAFSTQSVEEKESSDLIEDERHIVDDIEKDLEIEVATDSDQQPNDMDSQLNPDAKEFVPLSPVRNEFQSPPPPLTMENGKSPIINQILTGFADSVVSQSPRKGEMPLMDLQVPENENEFDKEADERAHEVNLLEENFQRIETPEEEINLKEAMQTDDKLEQGYKDDSQGFFEEEKSQSGEEYKVLESSFDQYSNGFQNKIDDTMNRSFYEGRDNNILADPAKSILNTTQPLIDDEDEKKVEDLCNEFLSNGEPVVEVAHQFETMTMQEDTKEQQMIESSDNFEAEKFVEEIKGIENNFNKYVDTELSPTDPAKQLSNEIQTVEETIFATHSPMKTIQETNLDTFVVQTSSFSEISAPEVKKSTADEFEVMQTTEIKENIPEAMEPVQHELIPSMDAPAPVVDDFMTTQQEIITEETKMSEIVAVAAAAAVAGTTAAIAKKPSSGMKKPAVVDAKKAKVPAKTVDAKKTEIKPKTAPVTKPSTTGTKPPVSKPMQAKTSTTTSAARPRPTTTAASVPPIKKAPLSKPAEAKPPVSKPASTLTKRPITSAPATRPAPPKTTDVKSKVNGTTERKPLASSAPATRAPAKPTTLTVKSKVNGTSSTTSAAKSPSSTITKTRLSTSVIEKSSTSSPIKEKSLNKSLSTTTTAKSPRPVSSTSTTTKTTTLKSPLSTAAKPLSAFGTKKPLSSVAKKSPSTTTTTTATTSVTKKPIGAAATKPATTVKKTTTTTTVVKKKVMNGDVVEETKQTTVAESAATLNGHHVNGNGDANESEQKMAVEMTEN